jgi:hypothetical protein
MFTARHYEKTAQVVSRIGDEHSRHDQTRLWMHVFARDNTSFKPETFMRKVEYLNLHPGSFSLFEEVDSA